MFFKQDNLKINILSVLNLSWNESDAYAAARNYHSLSYRIHGNACFTSANECINVKTGEIIYIPKGVGYTIKSGEEALIVIHFDIENSYENIIEAITPSDSKYFERKFLSIYNLWIKKHAGYQYECKSEMYKILARLHKQQYEHNLDFTNTIMNEVIEYIHAHFTERDLRVIDIAEMANMSDTYFRKLFVSAFNKTPLKYINDLRVSYALELLRSGYYSVKEASEKSGFDNPKYFTTVIKKETGRSPLSYKKENQSIL